MVRHAMRQRLTACSDGMQNMGTMGSGPSRSQRRGSSSPTRALYGDGASSRDPSPPLSPGRPPVGLPAPDQLSASTSHPLELQPPPAPPVAAQQVDAGFPAASLGESAASTSDAAGSGGVLQRSSSAHHTRLPSTSELHSERWDGSSNHSSTVSHSAPVSRQVSQTSTATDSSSRALLAVRATISSA